MTKKFYDEIFKIIEQKSKLFNEFIIFESKTNYWINISLLNKGFCM